MIDNYYTLASAICAKKEAVIKSAISHLIGDEWTIGDLTGRGRFSVYPNKEEVFSFDNVDLIIFYPPTTELESGIGLIIKAKQNYRLLYKP